MKAKTKIIRTESVGDERVVMFKIANAFRVVAVRTRRHATAGVRVHYVRANCVVAKASAAAGVFQSMIEDAVERFDTAARTAAESIAAAKPAETMRIRHNDRLASLLALRRSR